MVAGGSFVVRDENAPLKLLAQRVRQHGNEYSGPPQVEITTHALYTRAEVQTLGRIGLTAHEEWDTG